MLHDIVFLYEFPFAKDFCVNYIANEWDIPVKEVEELVGPCLYENKRLPFLLVAKENQEPAGLILAVERSDDVSAKYSPWLMALYVKEKCRGHGFGTELVNRACNELRRSGYGNVYIDTVRAEEFYKKRGWKFVEKVNWQDELTSIFSLKL